MTVPVAHHLVDNDHPDRTLCGEGTPVLPGTGPQVTYLCEDCRARLTERPA